MLHSANTGPQGDTVATVCFADAHVRTISTSGAVQMEVAVPCACGGGFRAVAWSGTGLHLAAVTVSSVLVVVDCRGHVVTHEGAHAASLPVAWSSCGTKVAAWDPQAMVLRVLDVRATPASRDASLVECSGRRGENVHDNALAARRSRECVRK